MAVLENVKFSYTFLFVHAYPGKFKMIEIPKSYVNCVTDLSRNFMKTIHATLKVLAGNSNFGVSFSY